MTPPTPAACGTCDGSGWYSRSEMCVECRGRAPTPPTAMSDAQIDEWRETAERTVARLGGGQVVFWADAARDLCDALKEARAALATAEAERLQLARALLDVSPIKPFDIARRLVAAADAGEKERGDG